MFRRSSPTRVILRRHKSNAWHSSEVLEYSGSRFQGHHCHLKSRDHVGDALKAFAHDHPAIIKRASHPHMYAWRCGDEVGSCDNGELGSGIALIEVLVRNEINNTLLVVTRWYGGRKLGGSRFRRIAAAGVDSLRQGGLAPSKQ